MRRKKGRKMEDTGEREQLTNAILLGQNKGANKCLHEIVVIWTIETEV